LPTAPPKAPRIVVAGAGAFGGWTALALLRRGARVTLVDPWGPGNSRSSSGGETRVIRCVYGPDDLYLGWALRSFELWRETEKRLRTPLLHRTGLLWMFEGDDTYLRSSLPGLERAGLSVEALDPAEARRRFPQIDFGGIARAWFEPEAGFLLARRACRRLAEAFVAEGGELLHAEARPGAFRGGRLGSLPLAGGSALAADAFVFAGGPWLGRMFPEILGTALRVTRQEVFYFGTPAGDPLWSEGRMPVWIDFGERRFYGIPGNEHRGFKVADDTRGEPFEPTLGDRLPSPEQLAGAREQLARRFSAPAGAPVVEARVCQYANTPDGDFLLDRHPEAADVWIAGGGSGHGFKLSPALGEHMAALVLGDAEPLPRFGLARFAAGGPFHDQFSAGDRP
jgi:sarcosine oxidase